MRGDLNVHIHVQIQGQAILARRIARESALRGKVGEPHRSETPGPALSLCICFFFAFAPADSLRAARLPFAFAPNRAEVDGVRASWHLRDVVNCAAILEY